MQTSIVWVDIPCVDLDRAIGFYSAVLGEAVHKSEAPGMALGVLPHENGTGGCLFVSPEVKPSQQGALIYLNCTGRLDAAVAAVTANGGTVLQPTHQIGPHGYRAVVVDSEGNRIALHSQ